MASVGACSGKGSGKGSSFITSQPTAIRRTVSKGASAPEKNADVAPNKVNGDCQKQYDFTKPSVVVTKAILAVQRPVVEGVTNTKNALISGISKHLQVAGLKTSCDESEVEPEVKPRDEPQVEREETPYNLAVFSELTSARDIIE